MLDRLKSALNSGLILLLQDLPTRGKLLNMISVKYRLLALNCLLFAVAILHASAAEVVIQPTPDGGLQPRLITDQAGNIHLLYFKKRSDQPRVREGNLYYRQYLSSEGRWGLPIKVSSQAFNVETFSIARAGMAIDGTGRIHVIWYRGREAEYLYARSDAARSAFEPQQSMVSDYIEGVDAGADIAAEGNHVAIVWGAGDLSREYERTVFVRLSSDNGASFGPEILAGNQDIGACACCSLATDFSDGDNLLVAYRSAINGIGRHMQLLTLGIAENSLAHSSYGEVHPLQEWEISSCPLSTNDIAADRDGQQWVVFETAARIVQKRLSAESIPSLVAEPFTKSRQKNPAIAFNAQGQHLIVWGEGISHSRGGRLNMQLFDADDEALDTGFSETIEIPEFSFPAAALLPTGEFLVLY